MEQSFLGVLKVRIKRGVNLAIRDSRSSDPYVVVTMCEQKKKTKIVKGSCNPEWNEEFSLYLKNVTTPIQLTVYDKDTFSDDDHMGEADIQIKPYLECVKMDLSGLPNGCAVRKVQPGRNNCLAEESCCTWNDGKITQEMFLRLKNVECGEVVVEIEWFDIPGGKGLSEVELHVCPRSSMYTEY